VVAVMMRRVMLLLMVVVVAAMYILLTSSSAYVVMMRGRRRGVRMLCWVDLPSPSTPSRTRPPLRRQKALNITAINRDER